MTAKKKKKCKLVECCMGHVVWDNLSELLHKTNIKFVLKKGKLYGHLFGNYKEKIQLQFKYTCFIK